MKKGNIDRFLASIEKKTKSKVLVYITNDLKHPFGCQISTDALSLFKNILRKQGKIKNRTLILNTNGGLLDAAWPIVSLVREYTTDKFEVIIPSKALSAGTLISIGADKIHMCDGSFLSPIDPTKHFSINNGGNIEQKQCSVEDIMGFIKFAKYKTGLRDQAALTEILKLATKEFDPSLIGSVNRTHGLIRNLSQKIIKTRKDTRKSGVDADRISKCLIEDLLSHQHLISLDEATEIGLDYASRINASLQKDIFDLFDYYKTEMHLEEKSQEIAELLRNISTTESKIVTIGACLHSAGLKYNHVTEANLSSMPAGPGKITANINIQKQSWSKL
ncbi:hypothetical protein ACFL16_00105 [Patescibacteria group bacterium]